MNAKGYPTRDEIVSALTKSRTSPARGIAGLSLAAMVAVLGGCGPSSSADPNAAADIAPAPHPQDVEAQDTMMGTFDTRFDE